MEIRQALTGMLPGVIAEIEKLLAETAALNPQVVKGYDCTMEKDSYYRWGAACRITAEDMAALKTVAEGMGFIWLSDDGDIAYTGGLTIEDFKTNRVSGFLELMPEEVI